MSDLITLTRLLTRTPLPEHPYPDTPTRIHLPDLLAPSQMWSYSSTGRPSRTGGQCVPHLRPAVRVAAGLAAGAPNMGAPERDAVLVHILVHANIPRHFQNPSRHAVAEVPVFFGLMSVVPGMAVASEGSAYKAELRRTAAAEETATDENL